MKIIVSLTTISGRLPTLAATLNSLLDQDEADYEVRVHYSSDPYLLDAGIKEVPEALREGANGKRVTWYRTPNLGPYRKLLPVLASALPLDTVIVTADDDTIYPKDWLSRLLFNYEEHKCVIAYRGHAMVRDGEAFAPYRQWMRSKQTLGRSMFWLPTGKDGVLYHASHFGDEVMNIAKALSLAPTADDLWFRWHAAAMGVPVYVINQDYAVGTFASNEDGRSLYKSYNEGGGNDVAIARLQRYGQDVLDFDFCKL